MYKVIMCFRKTSNIYNEWNYKTKKSYERYFSIRVKSYNTQIFTKKNFYLSGYEYRDNEFILKHTTK